MTNQTNNEINVNEDGYVSPSDQSQGMSKDVTAKIKSINCPECRCPDFINENLLGQGYRECKSSKQEWWTDIDYTYIHELENQLLEQHKYATKADEEIQHCKRKIDEVGHEIAALTIQLTAEKERSKALADAVQKHITDCGFDGNIKDALSAYTNTNTEK